MKKPISYKELSRRFRALSKRLREVDAQLIAAGIVASRAAEKLVRAMKRVES